MVKKNDIINVHIRDVDIDGNGIGVAEGDGRIVFCFGARAGDTLEAMAIKVTERYIVAKPKVLPASDCVQYPKCGGCTLLHFSYGETLAIKAKQVKDCLERIGKVNFAAAGGGQEVPSALFEQILPSPETLTYRNKSVYRFDIRNCDVISGFFRRNSHDTVACDGCLRETETAAAIRKAFCEAVKLFGISIYNEKIHKGTLRELMLRESSLDGKVMLCIVINSQTLGGKKTEKQLVNFLTEKFPQISSVFVNSNTSETNTILSESFRLVFGESTLKDKIGECIFELSPQSFFQVNSLQTENLYRKAFEYADLKGGERLLDVYCGIGTIGIFFAKELSKKNLTLKKLMGVEYTEKAIDDAKNNAIANGITCDTEFISGDAGEILNSDQYNFASDVVVVDPPRKGLDGKVIDKIALLSPEKVVYVSCNPATLARDAAIFADKGYYVKKVCPVDMFPFAGHVETVCLLTHKI